jgi:hypothetical protein
LPTESGGVVCAQVDLVAGAVDPEPHSLIRWAASRSSSKTTVIFVAIVASVPVMGYLHASITCPAAIARTVPVRPLSAGFWGGKRGANVG